jgi:hypothetical protein
MALDFLLLSPGFNSFLLLMSSISFVDLPLQEHQMTKKQNMGQNPYIS